MVKLSALKRTLSVTRNPLAPLLLMLSQGRKKISFRSGFTFQLTWPQFRIIRDSYPLLQKCAITQEAEDLFRIKHCMSEVAVDSSWLPLMCDLMQKFTIRQLQADLFNIKNNTLDLVGDICMLGCIQELETGEYNLDYRGKVVLDVGGFQGESAVFFAMRGARKIIIYEPVATHIELIKRNVAANHVNAEIHNEGVGDHDGTLKVSYTDMNSSFGLQTDGLHTTEIRIRKAAAVIDESEADIAKFDCEGAEESLIHVPNETLRKISYYLVEVHSPEIRNALIEKFQRGGFTLEKDTPKTPQLSVLTLRKTEPMITLSEGNSLSTVPVFSGTMQESF